MKVRQELLKYISPQTPEDVKLKVARGEAVDVELDPSDRVTALFVLSYDRSPAVSQDAKKSFEALSPQTFINALEKKLDPLVIKKIIAVKREDEGIVMMAGINPGIDDDTLKRLIEEGPNDLLDVLAEDKAILARRPFLAESLIKSVRVPNYLKERLSAFNPEAAKKEAQAAIAQAAVIPEGFLKKEEGAEAKAPAPAVDEHNMFKIIGSLGMAQKIKYALCGNKTAREILVKDANKIIASSVLKNPRITEEEVIRLATTKGTPDDLLRQIARNKEWIKNYSVKLGVAQNPKTPVMVSIKLLDHLYEKDLAKLAKSKNIPSVLASAARKKLEAKGRH